jgi:hypothetical protein
MLKRGLRSPLLKLQKSTFAGNSDIRHFKLIDALSTRLAL